MKAIVLLFVGAFSTCFASVEKLDQFIENTQESWQVPGVAICIVKEGKVVFTKGYGFCKMKKGQKVNENTIFQLASNTKPFTAATLATFVDKEQISWDEEIINTLPAFALKDPYPSRYCSSRDLLAHRSGLPAFTGDLLGRLGLSQKEILYKIRLIEPGSSFREKAAYSNVGYFTIGQVINALSGSTWQEVMKKNLIDPLQMKRTGFSSQLRGSNVASGHALINGKLQVVPWYEDEVFGPAGAMTSTASNMGNWMQMLLNKGEFNGKEILKEESVMEMFLPSMVSEIGFSETAPITEISGFSYGMGWGNYHYLGEMIVEKGGGLDGIRTLVTLIPEKKLGITILSNLNFTFFPEAIKAKFLELFLGGDLEKNIEEIREKEAVAQKLITAPTPPQPILPMTHKLSDFTGTFSSPLYGEFTLVEKGEALEVKAGPAEYKGIMNHFSGNTFLLDWEETINSGNMIVTFIFDPEGKPSSFEAETLGLFQKM